ncbi:hypothetical protein PPTG_21864 [Phytophthora nicotianae INRA-310]|uniref:Uncharacterized protein n=1 Tax=Phytophthora nicotianae (strain INRA-310) TaxID=761204 RepID=W2QSK5_PHYN3|nr:hypothetical protein PPTG_21864 [Phytophthora nicotianae INRA-310]ETN16093.1 hypothetical protein PPTG_21864 [Phytophthora nicotianae INRA-310]
MHEFTPKHFRVFILAKMNTAISLKVTTLGGYKSTVKDIYRQQQLLFRTRMLMIGRLFLLVLKRLKPPVTRQVRGRRRRQEKMALPYSAYEQACMNTLVLPDGGFAHVFLTLQ